MIRLLIASAYLAVAGCLPRAEASSPANDAGGRPSLAGAGCVFSWLEEGDGGTYHCSQACWNIRASGSDAGTRTLCDKQKCCPRGCAAERLPPEGECLAPKRSKPDCRLAAETAVRGFKEGAASCASDFECTRGLRFWGDRCSRIMKTFPPECRASMDGCPIVGEVACVNGQCVGRDSGFLDWRQFSIEVSPTDD
jgi:hypothetical protein